MALKLKASHFASVASAAISLVALMPAHAQTGPAAETVATDAGSNEGEDQTVSARDVVVVEGIGYRDRTNDTAPVLSYGTDYIQPFEPLSVGDALKRVPSVTFLSDVLESDGVRLRGLDPAYT